MTDTLAAQIEAHPCSVQVIRDMDAPKGAWPWIDGIAAECTGPHLRIETPNDAEAIVFWHDERPAAVVLNLRDQFNHSVQFRIDLRPAIVTALRLAEAVTQPCDRCGKPVTVNAVSPSECFCSFECADPETDRQAEAAPGVVEAPRVDRWRKASVALGSWLSAALDDPKVCEAMKADINEWFSAGEPFEALARQHGAREGWQGPAYEYGHTWGPENGPGDTDVHLPAAPATDVGEG